MITSPTLTEALQPTVARDSAADVITAYVSMNEAQEYLQTVLDTLEQHMTAGERSDLLRERDRAMLRLAFALRRFRAVLSNRHD